MNITKLTRNPTFLGLHISPLGNLLSERQSRPSCYFCANFLEKFPTLSFPEDLISIKKLKFFILQNQKMNYSLEGHHWRRFQAACRFHLFESKKCDWFLGTKAKLNQTDSQLWQKHLELKLRHKCGW